ncbi:glycosyltransferase family 4 protein [Roseomonas rosulenta]|uniref:glycosyltransferase family 4 protein n=1 Tax=Roseomonas rosulenta TaxID=2748667 RepID=UPI0018DF036B|nr:glycosyltransferase family 4 protein [Roseomonas rosulenta]
MTEPAPRHVLAVFSTFAVGGPQVRFCSLVEALGPACRYSIISMDGAFDCAARLPPATQVAFPALALRKGATLSNIVSFARMLRTLRPDVLLTHNWGSIEWAMANHLVGCRHVHIEDGFGPDEQAAQIPRRVLLRRLFLRRATVVVPSQTLRAIAIRDWRLPERRLRYIPNGIDLDAFARVPVPAPRPEATICTVAALRAEKNIARLLKAFAMLPAELEARLVVAGDGAERAGLEALAATLGLRERVEFLGQRGDVPKVLAGASVFALSSDTEQMPLSVLEAMATGLPVASTDVGDVRSILAPENAPFVVPRDDAALSRAIAALLVDAELRRHIGTANRRRAEECFGEQAMFEAYREVLFGAG